MSAFMIPAVLYDDTFHRADERENSHACAARGSGRLEASLGIVIPIVGSLHMVSSMTYSVRTMETEDNMRISTNDQTRTKRFNLRATPRQEQLIRVAAKRQGLNVTDFILESACEKAEQTLT